MITAYSDDHRLHEGKAELNDGKLTPCFERPERANAIISCVHKANLGDVLPAVDFGALISGHRRSTMGERITAYRPDALVVSLGVDTFRGDPISRFRLDTSDYVTVGRRIAKGGTPCVFVMEGGYAIDAIGVNVTNVLPDSSSKIEDDGYETAYQCLLARCHDDHDISESSGAGRFCAHR